MIVAGAPGGQDGAHLRRWLTGLAGLALAGGVVLVLAWTAASGTVVETDQKLYAMVGALGAVMVSGAAGGGVAVARRTVRVRLAAAGAELDRRLAPQIGGVCASGASAALRVAAANMRHYHRPGCQLVAGKPARPVAPSEYEAAGLRPCLVCDAGIRGAGVCDA